MKLLKFVREISVVNLPGVRPYSSSGYYEQYNRILKISIFLNFKWFFFLALYVFILCSQEHDSSVAQNVLH